MLNSSCLVQYGYVLLERYYGPWQVQGRFKQRCEVTPREWLWFSKKLLIAAEIFILGELNQNTYRGLIFRHRPLQYFEYVLCLDENMNGVNYGGKEGS